jgi:hypothetical protein
MAVFVSLVGALFAIGYGIYLVCISERMRIIKTIQVPMVASVVAMIIP